MKFLSKIHAATNGVPNKRTQFSCVTCQDGNTSIKFHGSIGNVYLHWKYAHANNNQPFQFYMVDPVAYFQCNSKPEGASVSPVLIWNRSDKRVKSIRKTHTEILRSDIINPFRLNDEQISQLLQIDVHTEDDQTDGNKCHESISKQPHFHTICTYCSAKLSTDKYLHHLKEHCGNLTCFECNECVGSLADIFAHDETVHGINRIEYQCEKLHTQLNLRFLNTKMIFENGLVLYNLNVIDTQFDGSPVHDSFVRRMIETEKLKYSKINAYKNSEPTLTATETSNTIDLTVEVMAEFDNEQFLANELKKQNDIIKNFTVRGFPRVDGLDLMNMFMAFCKHINANVQPDDIRSIARQNDDSDLVIVKFQHLHQKKLVRRLAIDMEIYLHQFIDLPAEVQPERIYINSQLTHFYTEIQKLAKIARSMGSLHSYQLRSEGFLVARTADSPLHLVLSTKQLQDYIDGGGNGIQDKK